jgi:hypothetical protein
MERRPYAGGVMQIKAADDRTVDVRALEELASSSDLPAPTRQRIEGEIRSIRAGVVGERDAAYEIEFYFGASRNYVTIHDLRLEHDGRVAQIDHLIINRVLQVWVCESKHFVDSVSINPQGEWTRSYRGREYGVPSPIEQNKKHIPVLEEVFKSDAVSLPRRIFTMRPELLSLVLVSNNAVIKRPRTKVEGLDTVIKAERLKTGIFDTWDDRVRTMVQRLVKTETIERIALDLVALHRPIAFDWTAKFGLTHESGNTPPPPLPAPAVATTQRGNRDDPSGKPCDRCGGSTTFAEVAYCRYNAKVFNGRRYCRPCQAIVLGAS